MVRKQSLSTTVGVSVLGEENVHNCLIVLDCVCVAVVDVFALELWSDSKQPVSVKLYYQQSNKHT